MVRGSTSGTGSCDHLEAASVGESVTNVAQLRRPPPDLTANNTSVNSVVTDYDYGEWLDGAELGSRISPARRFFALFVTFDALLCAILWLVCIVLRDKNLVEEVTRQIIHYTVETSLFDIVASSFFRFVLLILCYIIVKMDHWSVVTLTVVASSIGCIVKIMYFTWHSTGTGSTFQATLLIAFFILGWLEVWLWDSRVLPQERRARAIIQRRYDWWQRSAGDSGQHTGLLATGRHQRIADYLSTCTASVANFYSPMASPPDSESGSDPGLNPDSTQLFSSSLSPSTEQRALNERRLRLRMRAEEACRTALDILNSADWSEEAQLGEADFLYCRRADSGGRSQHMFTCTVGVSCRKLAAQLVTVGSVCDRCPEWNSAVHVCRQLEQVDGQCELRYQRTTPLMRGTVAARAFTTLRLCGQRGATYFSAFVSVPCPQDGGGGVDSAGELSSSQTDDCIDADEKSRAVAGFMFPTIVMIRPCVDRPRHCIVEWLINSDCKPGMVPRRLVDRGTCHAARALHSDLQQLGAKLTGKN